ncbi:MAG: glycosyltransferase family 39 protein [Chloroflexi bacterium]|nr:glycosyltransferase family 39 protein [Chloroflexota bacterium]
MKLEPLHHIRTLWQHPQAWRWLMVGILLLSFALRLHRVGDRALWWDEGWSIWVARQSLAAIVYQTGHDVHPPLYFGLLHLWRAASGDSEFALRSLSVVFGSLTIAAVYLLGRSVGGWRVGLLAALFLATSRFHIVWSQEIRMYALAGFLAALGTWAARRVWERGKLADYVLYSGCMTAGLLTLYLFFPIPLAINLAWLWVLWRARQRRKTLWAWGAAQLVILLIVGAWLVYALPGFLSTSSATPIAVADFLKIYWTVLVTGIPLNVELYARLTLPVLAVFGTAVFTLVHHARHDGRMGRWRMARDVTLFLSGLLIPLGVVVYVTLPKVGAYAPPFDPRYLVIFTGYYVILLAWGLGRLGSGRRWPLAAALGAAVVGVSLVGMRGYYDGRIRLDDYKSLAATLRAYAHENDAVILYSDPDWPIFAYHYPGAWAGLPHLWQMTPETAVNYLAPIWQDSEGVWLAITPYGGVTDPQGYVPAWLAEQAVAVSEYNFGDKALRFYARTPERAETARVVAAGAAPQFETFAVVKTAMHFIGYDLPSGTYRSGDTIRMGFYFYRDWRVADESHTMEIGLIDRTGRSWADGLTRLTPDDATSETGLIRKEALFTLPLEMPSGHYSFYMLNCGGDMERFAHITIQQRNLGFVDPADVTISHPLDAPFANGISLVGYDVETTTAVPGGAVDLTLYWQTDQPITGQYKVFTHLLGDVYNAETGNFLWGQQDNEPVNGRRPTSTWRPDEVIVDKYAIPVAAHTPAGVYTLEVGLYNPITGERLLLVDEVGTAVADHVVLQTAVTITLPE